MERIPLDRKAEFMILTFRPLSLDAGKGRVLIEIFDNLNRDLLAIYVPYQDFRYGDFLYFTLASNEYLNNAPLPRYLKIEYRADSYEAVNLPLADGLSTRYSMQDLLEHSYVSDSPVDIFLEEEDLERWGSLAVEV